MAHAKHRRLHAKHGRLNSTLWRALMVSTAVSALVGVILVTGGAVAVTSSGISVPRSAPVEPPPTRTPNAPAIVIAKSATQDLSGGWLMQSHGRYLLFVSTSFGNLRDNIPLRVGSPGHWSKPVDALPTMPPWAVPISRNGTTWEPEVHRFGSTYVLYFSAVVAGVTPTTHCLGTAVATSAVGPYSPSPQPIVCQLNQGGDIDPQVVMDGTSPRARPYLVWKSDNNSTTHTGTDLVWSQPLTSNGLAVVGSPATIYGTHWAPAWAQPIVEAPQMVEAPNGSWWLFYSGGASLAGPTYAIGVAKCVGISGPCTAFGTQPLITNNAQGVGPGEEAIYQAKGSSMWLLYNPWHTDIPFKWFRPVVAARVGWDNAGPYIAQAGTFPAPTATAPA
ncbi:MAG: family 43 glycosylhydrolase [Acidimicrobiales bacterium]